MNQSLLLALMILIYSKSVKTLTSQHEQVKHASVDCFDEVDAFEALMDSKDSMNLMKKQGLLEGFDEGGTFEVVDRRCVWEMKVEDCEAEEIGQEAGLF